jgi:hypothetical protein
VPNKDTLTAIAKSLKVHVVKYDRREDIENKLIEFVIGAKLRRDLQKKYRQHRRQQDAASTIKH